MAGLEELQARLVQAKAERRKAEQAVDKGYGSLTGLHSVIHRTNESTWEGREARATRDKLNAAHQEYHLAVAALAMAEKSAPEAKP